MPRIAKYAGGLLTAASAIIAIVLGITQLWPDPAPTPTPVPALSGTLSDVTIAEQNVPLGDFCERDADLNCSAIDQVNFPRLGAIVSFTSHARGYKDQELSIRWTVCQASGAEGVCNRVSNPDLVDQDAWPDGVYTSTADEDQNSGDIWVTQPLTPGDFFIRLELFQPDGTRLDVEDTSEFTVT
jgi:hypothetical protein